MAGAWTMTEEGEFVLDKTYQEHLDAAKTAGGVAWRDAVYSYLAEHTQYDVEFIGLEFMRRCQEDGTPLEIVDEFIIEALEGNL